MITTFAASAESFAAERKPVLAEAFDSLRPTVKEAMGRIGIPQWQRIIVSAALDLFDLTARSQVDAWSQNLDDLRDLFEHELNEALARTTAAAPDQREAQADTLARWVSSYTVNAATEAATSTDTDGVGLEWVCMEDSKVRSAHREAHGQRVSTGSMFEVAGVEMSYPGQPVGDPSNWINCRCLAMPTMLDGFTVNSVTASAPGLKRDGSAPKCEYCDATAISYVLHSEGMAYVPACAEHLQQAKDDAAKSVPGGAPDPGNIDRVGEYSGGRATDPVTSFAATAATEEPEFDTAVIVALPAADDPVNGASSESHAHCTLLFLGPTENLSLVELSDALAAFVEEGQVGVITDAVNGSATLGAEGAMVSLLDANNLVHIRNGLLMNPAIKAAHESVEQFPTWIPHVTLGYPENLPAATFDGEAITFDRLALWFGDDKESAVFQLGEAMPEKKVVHAEDPEFTQEMADAFAATAAPAAPVEDAEPAEAEAPAEAGEPELRKWHGVIAPEAAPSGDRRQFAERALTARSLPLPLKAMFVDDEGHKGSVVVGRIDNVYRKEGLILADGVWDESPEADRAWLMIERKMWRGVSVDLDAAEANLEDMDDAELLEFLAGRISSATVCAIPAFAQAFVANGGWENYDPATAPNAEMNEIPDWTEPAALVAAAVMAPKKISADYFRNPMLEGPTPLSLGHEGHIFGHLAAWDACHIGFEVCTTAPPSNTDYAYFLTGQVFTDAGPVAVGQITLGKKDIGGHAADGISMRAAIAHYDRTGTAVADITVGEDEFGIWFSGKLRDNVTEEQVHELFAAGLSGDWRGVRFRGSESMELVAALAVNVQGFPIPRTSFAMDGDRQVSLVAAGVVPNPRSIEAASIFRELRNLEYSTIVNEFSLLEGK
ncbi:capsid maturation protease [Arthrobacter phage Rizwana]|nr:capsid maturation protease [Arthrobacter phage Rizwana]